MIAHWPFGDASSIGLLCDYHSSPPFRLHSLVAVGLGGAQIWDNG